MNIILLRLSLVTSDLEEPHSCFDVYDYYIEFEDRLFGAFINVMLSREAPLEHFSNGLDRIRKMLAEDLKNYDETLIFQNKNFFFGFGELSPDTKTLLPYEIEKTDLLHLMDQIHILLQHASDYLKYISSCEKKMIMPNNLEFKL